MAVVVASMPLMPAREEKTHFMEVVVGTPQQGKEQNSATREALLQAREAKRGRKFPTRLAVLQHAEQEQITRDLQASKKHLRTQLLLQ